jgi:hypothetical protein
LTKERRKTMIIEHANISFPVIKRLIFLDRSLAGQKETERPAS